MASHLRVRAKGLTKAWSSVWSAPTFFVWPHFLLLFPHTHCCRYTHLIVPKKHHLRISAFPSMHVPWICLYFRTLLKYYLKKTFPGQWKISKPCPAPLPNIPYPLCLLLFSPYHWPTSMRTSCEWPRAWALGPRIPAFESLTHSWVCALGQTFDQRGT